MLNRVQILVVICLIGSTISINLFNKIELTTSKTAKCLDGSPYAFYTYTPDDTSVAENKLLIYFQQTPFGWCAKTDSSTTLQQCYKFITDQYLIDFGSSKNYSNSETFLNGILSIGDSGRFSPWNKVLIKSCDGGSYLGNRDPISYKKQNIYFRGAANVMQAFSYLATDFGLRNYEEIVLAGSFNGGIAAMLWSEYLTTLTLSPVRILVDAGVFPNLIHKSNTPVIQNRMKSIDKLMLNGDHVPNSGCAKSNEGEQWKCLFADQLQNYLNVPAFYTQSYYDGFGVSQILGFNCTQQFGSLSECTEKERQTILDFGVKTKQILKKASNKIKSGAFGIACVGHEFVSGRWSNEEFEVPMSSGKTVINTVGEWISKWDKLIAMDEVVWPHNVPCARKAINNIQFESS